MKKILKWTLIVVPVIVIIAIVVVVLKLDTIVKSTIETQSTASTNLSTTLGRAHLSILGGHVNLGDLKIGSPKGFSAPTMFDMKDLNVKVSYSELRATPMRISEITIDGPRLVIEQQGGKLNVNAAMEQMPKSEPSSSELRMVIGKLDLNNTQVIVRPGIPGLKPEYALTLPSISVKDIGTGEGNQNGAAIQDVLKKVLAAMTEKLKESESVPSELRTWIGANPETFKAAAAQELQKQQDKYKEQAGQEIQKGLGNLLGGKK